MRATLLLCVLATLCLNNISSQLMQPAYSGEETEVNTNDPKIIALAQESIIQYEKDTGSPQTYYAKVTRATQAIVSGVITKLYFYAIPNCFYHCNAQVLSCASSVWTQEWLHRKDIKVKCSPALF